MALPCLLAHWDMVSLSCLDTVCTGRYLIFGISLCGNFVWGTGQYESALVKQQADHFVPRFSDSFMLLPKALEYSSRVQVGCLNWHSLHIFNLTCQANHWLNGESWTQCVNIFIEAFLDHSPIDRGRQLFSRQWFPVDHWLCLSQCYLLSHFQWCHCSKMKQP